MSRHGPGRFLGELGLLEGQVAFDTAVVGEPGAVLAVPLERQRDLVARDPILGDLVLRAYLGRRSLLIGVGAGFRILGSAYSPDTLRLREFAARNRLPHRWTDLEKDQEAGQVLHRFGIRPDETPVVIWNGRKVLRHPSPADLARLIGPPHSRLTDLTCDLLVIGTGPAGLATAVYGASDSLLTVAVDATATGGQAGTSSRIENYLGFPSGVSGGELMERSVLQARRFGARITVPAEATGLERRDGHYAVTFADGSETATDTVVVAAGVRYRKLEADGIGRLEGTSVHYAATLHEANLCRDDPVAVVGGGNSAGQAALFLAGHTPQVYLLVRSGDLGKDIPLSGGPVGAAPEGRDPDTHRGTTGARGRRPAIANRRGQQHRSAKGVEGPRLVALHIGRLQAVAVAVVFPSLQGHVGRVSRVCSPVTRQGLVPCL